LELFILRHGEVAKKLNRFVGAGGSLTYLGISEIKTIANSIKKLRIKIDLILTSPIFACKQTAEIVNNIFKKRITIVICNDLKPESNFLYFYSEILKYKDVSSILIIGHEPYLSNMISDIISNNNNNSMDKSYNENRINIVLKKAGLSKINITSTVPKLKGELSWLLTPKILKKLS
jgi:phosphohistidine phosphatase